MAKTMNKKECIEMLRNYCDKIERGDYFADYISGNYESETSVFIFGNRNYGEITVQLGAVNFSIKLYNATIDEIIEGEKGGAE